MRPGIIVREERCLEGKFGKELGKARVARLILRGVNVEVRCGEITLLVGQSGCGKTTCSP